MNLEGIFSGTEPLTGTTGLVLFILIAWSLVWKGLALWKAARNNCLSWYIAILILNTVGILDIIFYFFICNKKK